MKESASAKYVYALIVVVLAAFVALSLIVINQPDDKVVDQAGVVIGFATVIAFQLFGIIRTIENAGAVAAGVEAAKAAAQLAAQTAQVAHSTARTAQATAEATQVAVQGVAEKINGQQALLVAAARAAGVAEGRVQAASDLP